MKISCRSVLSWTAPLFRLAPGAVLAGSGYLKAVRSPAEFAATLESYWIFPASFVIPVARWIPWIELLVGLCLVFGFFTRGAALAAVGLYAAFIAVLIQAIVRKLPMTDCGCFGSIGPHLQPAQALFLDAGLLILCLLVFFDRERRLSADQWIERP